MGFFRGGSEEASLHPWGGLGSLYITVSLMQKVLRWKSHQAQNEILFGALQVWTNPSSDLTQTHKSAGYVVAGGPSLLCFQRWLGGREEGKVLGKK